MPADWLTYITTIFAVSSGLFAVVKWLDQRRQELQAKRFEQYWRLVTLSTETTFVAQQKVAILQLRLFPEFREETVDFLEDAKSSSGGWTAQNATQIDKVIQYLKD